MSPKTHIRTGRQDLVAFATRKMRHDKRLKISGLVVCPHLFWKFLVVSSATRQEFFSLVRISLKQCELTKYIWTLKDAGKQFSIQWRILERVKGRTIAGECKLCVAEKLQILSHPQKELLLNNRTTIQCTHKIKDSLASLHSNRGRPRGRTVRRGNVGARETSN